MKLLDGEWTDSERVAGEAFLRLAKSCDEFEGYSQPHASRIARIADELSKLFSMAHRDRLSIRLAALSHDLGEMVMNRDYLNRPGPLTDEERIDLARHPVIGEQQAARSGGDRSVQLIVRWHHEWWDGSGYPDALRGYVIPLPARVLRVADAYASLTDSRPYRPALSEEEARKHLIDWAGIEFDPRVVTAFLSLEEFPELRSHLKAPANEVNNHTPEEQQENGLAVETGISVSQA